jgi:hypothetical protein
MRPTLVSSDRSILVRDVAVVDVEHGTIRHRQDVRDGGDASVAQGQAAD